MSRHSFTKWLEDEHNAARCALLSLYEQRDSMKYIESVRLESEYMEKVGESEQVVIKEEMECELLRQKQQMVQMALNRREPIDEAAIDSRIDEQRQQMLKEAEGSAAPQDYAELSEEQDAELKELYHTIVRRFHPQMHPELTEAHKHLFKKAQDAYRIKGIEALRLTYEMLLSTVEEEDSLRLLEMIQSIESSNVVSGEDGQGSSKISYQPTDYTLAAMIYPGFKPTAEELTIQEEIERCRREMDSVMDEMQAMRDDFPYSAAEMLADPEQVSAYKAELSHRLHNAVAGRKRLTDEIRTMIDSQQIRPHKRKRG